MRWLNRLKTEWARLFHPRYQPLEITTRQVIGFSHAFYAMRNPHMSHAKASLENDLRLGKKLVLAGDEHAKFARGIIVYADLKFQIGWMIEWDTYRHGREVLSTSSTMHDELCGLAGSALAAAKQALLPDKIYHQTAWVSYQALRNIYRQRHNHRHPDWRIFCAWVETLPYAEDLITCQK